MAGVQIRCPNPAVEKEDSPVQITLFYSSLAQWMRAWHQATRFSFFSGPTLNFFLGTLL